MPQLITFDSGNKIRYIYDANGVKLKQEILNSSDVVTATTHYVNGIQYKTDNNTTYLDFIQTEEGREVPKADGSFMYEYFMKDHLGNVRASIATEKETIEYLATMEADSAQKEESYYTNLETVTRWRNKSSWR